VNRARTSDDHRVRVARDRIDCLGQTRNKELELPKDQRGSSEGGTTTPGD
jgi:hypothetical protein